VEQETFTSVLAMRGGRPAGIDVVIDIVVR
jgi:hypothetical protein